MSQEPPDGWVAMDDTLVPAKTIAGYAARGEELQGGCQAHGCRRRCWIDPHARYEVQLRNLPLATLQNLFRCNRLDGCGFAFTGPRQDQSVRLADLYGRPNVRIRIRCRSCGWTRSPRPEEVAGVLSRSRTGGPYPGSHGAGGDGGQTLPGLQEGRLVRRGRLAADRHGDLASQGREPFRRPCRSAEVR